MGVSKFEHERRGSLQLEVPEHPHSPFMMTDFWVVGWCEGGLGIEACFVWLVLDLRWLVKKEEKDVGQAALLCLPSREAQAYPGSHRPDIPT